MAEKRRRPHELRTVAEAELQAQLHTLRRELWEGRMKLTQGASQQTHAPSATRRQIARILTVLQERHA